jgi:DNA polymerase-3 subunit gamma/tau
MLRTHGELGYKQEQRFHLELGLLKMAHAQRLLPIEQLLSEVAGSSSNSPGTGSASRPSARPAILGSNAGETRRTEAVAPVRPAQVSPFAADSARKGGPRQEFASETSSKTSSSANSISSHPGSAEGPPMFATEGSSARVIMSAAAPANLSENSAERRVDSRIEPVRESQTSLKSEEVLQIAPQISPVKPASPVPSAPVERLQSAVLQALMDGNQRILVSMLEAGDWSVEGNEVVVKVAESQTVVDMSLSADARRLAIASASGVLGRAVKLKIVPGAGVASTEVKRNGGVRAVATNPEAGGRGRAEQDAVVRRLQEKFGAEIRTVIDYKEKR